MPQGRVLTKDFLSFCSILLQVKMSRLKLLKIELPVRKELAGNTQGTRQTASGASQAVYHRSRTKAGTPPRSFFMGDGGERTVGTSCFTVLNPGVSISVPT